MFAAIAEIALYTPLSLVITRELDRLHVIIAGKGDKPLAFATPVRVTGTPAELDEQLPAQLTAYAAQMVTPTTAIALPAPDAGAPAKKKTPARTTVPLKPAKAKKPAAPKKTAAPKQPPREPKPAKAETPKPVPAPKPAAAETPRADLPGKPECIADLHALQALHGAKLTRRLFIKEAATGRRYEKLWKNFEAFTAEAAPVADLFTQPATTTRVALDSAAPWPFPDPSNAAAPAGVESVSPADPARTTPAAAAPDKPRVVGPTAGARPIESTTEATE